MKIRSRHDREIVRIIPKAREEFGVARECGLKACYQVVEDAKNGLIQRGEAEERDENDNQDDAVTKKGERTQDTPLLYPLSCRWRDSNRPR